MPVTSKSLGRWVAEISQSVAVIMRRFEVTFGYPPGDNVVVEADAEAGREAGRMLSKVYRLGRGIADRIGLRRGGLRR